MLPKPGGGNALMGWANSGGDEALNAGNAGATGLEGCIGAIPDDDAPKGALGSDIL